MEILGNHIYATLLPASWKLASLYKVLGTYRVNGQFFRCIVIPWNHALFYRVSTVKLCDKERFDKEKIGVKEHFPVTNCQFTS